MRDETEYRQLMGDKQLFHQYLAEIIEYHPENFPPEIEAGYVLHGSFKSQKMGVPIRRIRLKATGEVYQLRPSIFMPYLAGKTDEVEKALYLRRFGVQR